MTTPPNISLESYDAERHDFELVLAAVDKIEAASITELRDLEWVHELICSVGLSPLDPADAYADKADLVNGSRQGVVQYPIEYARWLRLLADYPINSYLEIGCFNGCTASLATAYLYRLNPGLKAVTVDLYPWFLFYNSVKARIPLEYCVGMTSYHFRDRAFDAVFIDADHSFVWAWADYQNVGRSARICGLHDVMSEFYYRSEELGGVTAVWELIKREEGGVNIRFEEISDHPSANFGIGVRIRDVVTSK